jgi:hypothetical protein
MHIEVEIFFRSLKEEMPDYFKNKTVLEIGSYNVNGSLREFFNCSDWVGVDLVEGPGVDIVSSGHEFKSDKKFDVVVSSECFEHNPHYGNTFVNMVNHTSAGGLVSFTCASTGRAEHGTSRTSLADSPGTAFLNWDYYKNLEETDFDSSLIAEKFENYLFLKNTINCDLMFFGIKKYDYSKSIHAPLRWDRIIDNLRFKILSHHFKQIHDEQVRNFMVLEQLVREQNFVINQTGSIILEQHEILLDMSAKHLVYRISTGLKRALDFLKRKFC